VPRLGGSEIMYIPVGGAVTVTKLTPFEKVIDDNDSVDMFPRVFIFIIMHTLFVCKVC